MSTRQPKVRALEVFRVLLRTRSVTQTAQILGITQPGVSKTLQQLEGDLGFKLFERVAGRLHPTPEAELLLPSVEDVFTSLSLLVGIGHEIRDQHVGQVSIAAIPSLAAVFLPQAVREVAALHPRVHASVQILPTSQIGNAVSSGAVDLGLCHDLVDEHLTQAEDLGAFEMACLVPTDHDLANRDSISAADLDGMPYVSYGPHTLIGLRIMAAFRAAGGVNFAPTIEAAASLTVCTIAAQCNMPAVVEGYVLSLGWWPGLRAVPLTPPVILRQRILTTRKRPISAAARLFRDEYRTIVTKAM